MSRDTERVACLGLNYENYEMCVGLTMKSLWLDYEMFQFALRDYFSLTSFKRPGECELGVFNGVYLDNRRKRGEMGVLSDCQHGTRDVPDAGSWLCKYTALSDDSFHLGRAELNFC